MRHASSHTHCRRTGLLTQMGLHTDDPLYARWPLLCTPATLPGGRSRRCSPAIPAIAPGQATQNYTTKLPVQTPKGGRQVTYCIHLDILAWWLAGLNEKLIRPEFAPRLVRFQKDIVQAASNMLFGTPHEDAQPEEAAKGKIIRLQDWLGPSSQPLDTSLLDGLHDDEE